MHMYMTESDAILRPQAAESWKGPESLITSHGSYTNTDPLVFPFLFWEK